jgi:hypothetical protein
LPSTLRLDNLVNLLHERLCELLPRSLSRRHRWWTSIRANVLEAYPFGGTLHSDCSGDGGQTHPHHRWPVTRTVLTSEDASLLALELGFDPVIDDEAGFDLSNTGD